MRRLLFALLLFGFYLGSYAQISDDSYKIEVKLRGTTDTVLYLANYYGDKTYLADTAYLKGKKYFVFQKNEKLEGGLYIIVNQGRKSIFEFLLSDSRDIKFETNTDDYIANMKISGSDENTRFYDYLNFSGDLYIQMKPIRSRMKEIGPKSDSLVYYREKMSAINLEMTNYKENYIVSYPKTFLSNFFSLIKEPIVPDTLLTLPDGSKDSTYPFRYYKTHYWDQVDLSDDRLIRTPVYHTKLDNYFDRAVGNSADTIIVHIDEILSQMDENGDLYKFTLWHLTIKYDESNIMGHDAILVHMADEYFAKGKAAWLNSEVVENILKEANKRRSTVIGQQAPNLIMQDTNLQPKSIYDIKTDFVVMYFWDPACGHCKEETPRLVDFYNEYADSLNVEIFAICADTNLKKMKKYVKEKKMSFINVNGPRTYTADYHELYNIFSTPIVIVLDKNKKIIAKRLMSEQLLEFISNHKKYFEFKEE